MKWSLKNSVLLISVLFIAVGVSHAWESWEMDLFELVEDVNQDFYEFLGVERGVKPNVLKKVYRKLSLQWHPDRNKEPEAEKKFRKIVAVYETLKDLKTRDKYHEILEFGLPNWRTGAQYFFRRARKLSTSELSIAISIIITIGHYLTLWASHFEKKLTMEEKMSEIKKKLEKKQKKRNYKASELDDIDNEMTEMYNSLPSPALADTLPYRLVCFSFSSIIASPSFIMSLMSKKKADENEGEEPAAAQYNRSPRSSKRKEREAEHKKLNPKNIEKSDITITASSNQQNTETKSTESSLKTNKEWSDKEKAELIKAVSKYPSGTASRWNKIGELLNRSASDCINMEKQMKANYSNSNYLNSASWSETKTTVLNYKEDPTISVKLDENSNIETKSIWSQDQQVKLENALKSVDKDASNRWELISELVPGKNKDECVNRFKTICTDMKKKQQKA